MNNSNPKLAILFWFYKEPKICRNHLQLLRENNPTIPIYGLYGGELNDVNDFKFILDEYLDDFYVFDQDKSSSWKWHLGDQLISSWYSQRGKNLSWDTIVIVQWDMLIFGSVNQLFSMLRKDDVLLSGLRIISEIEERWGWTSNSIAPELRSQYLNFLDHVKEKYSYAHEPMCCLFIVVCLPRIFMENYSKIEQPELGFLEYKVPIYAQIFELTFCTNHPFQPWWPGDPETTENRRTLNAKRIDIGIMSILRNLTDKNGVRIFHPYRKFYPLKSIQWLMIISIFLQEFFERFSELIRLVKHNKKY